MKRRRIDWVSILVGLFVILFVGLIALAGTVQYYVQKAECEDAGGTWLMWSRHCLAKGAAKGVR